MLENLANSAYLDAIIISTFWSSIILFAVIFRLIGSINKDITKFYRNDY